MHRCSLLRGEDKSWDEDSFPSTQCMGQPGGAEGPGVKIMVESCDDGEKEAKLGDFLVGDDAADCSDEFSGQEYEF